VEGINRVDDLLKSLGEQITFPADSGILQFAQIPDGRAFDQVSCYCSGTLHIPVEDLFYLLKQIIKLVTC
jgi:hypothetical protein